MADINLKVKFDIEESLMVVRAVALRDPYIDNLGHAVCFYCGASEGDSHNDKCELIMARDILSNVSIEDVK